MYTPKFNQVSDRAILIEAMRAYSFAILFGPLNSTDSADPRTTPPIFPSSSKTKARTASSKATCKSQSHWQSLADRETLVVFPGPHSYVCPSLYAEELSVPTWNYIAIHAHGTLSLVEDDAGKETLLAGLIEANDLPMPNSGTISPTDSAAPCSPASSASASPSRASKANSRSARIAPKLTAAPSTPPTPPAPPTSKHSPPG